MQITEIKQTSTGRLTVCFEDGTEVKSSLSVVADLRLYAGRELDQEQMAELSALSRRSLARDRALDWVSRRQMSRKELRIKLLQKGESEATADYCIQWLEDNGFLNEESYSRAIARHYAAKGYGQGRVRAELQRRGLDRELWDEAFAEIPEDTDKIDKLISARLKDPSDRAQAAKVSQALFRRGFSWDEIRAALKRFNTDCEEN